LRRVLGTPMLVLYGLGVIIGTGIYVLVGTIVATAVAARHGLCWHSRCHDRLVVCQACCTLSRDGRRRAYIREEGLSRCPRDHKI
jgi:hypothetical protein